MTLPISKIDERFMAFPALDLEQGVGLVTGRQFVTDRETTLGQPSFYPESLPSRCHRGHGRRSMGIKQLIRGWGRGVAPK